MLISGHIAAGYLLTKFAIQSLVAHYPQINEPRFWIFGIGASFLIDIDELYARHNPPRW